MAKQKQYLYAIVNKITGATYFGITNNFEKRMSSHKSYNCDDNRKLYNSIKKYGWENFDKEIVLTSRCRTEILEFEKYYIAEFDTWKNGLNSTPGGDGGALGGEAPNAVKVRSYHIPTEEERIFNSLVDASDELDIDANSISKVIRGKINRTGDYIFKKYDPDNPNEPFDISSLLTSEEARIKASATSREARKLAIVGTHLTGFTIEFEAVIDAHRALGISDGHIVDCCRGNRGMAGDFTWSYKDENLRAKFSMFERSKSGAKSKGEVFRILENGTKDVYASASDAQRKTGINHIQRSVETGMKAGGFRWYATIPEEYMNVPRKTKNKGGVYRLVDGKKDEYETTGKAEKTLGITHVRRAIETGMKAGGFRWYAI